MADKLERDERKADAPASGGVAWPLGSPPDVTTSNDPMIVNWAHAALELVERQRDYGAWFWHLPSGGFYMTANSRAVLGISEEANDLEGLLATVHPEDRVEVEQKVRSRLDEREEYDLTFRIVRDGENRWVRARGAVTHWEQGTPVMMAGSVEDTTYQVQTLNDLQASELRFRTLLDNAPYPIVITRPRDRTLRYLNQRAEELLEKLDVPSSEFTVLDLVNDVELSEKIRAEMSASGSTSDYELPLKLKDGSSLWVTLRGNLIEYEGETGAYFALYDVTNRRELEEQLRTQATTDALTGLANRSELLSQLGFTAALSDRSNGGFALLLLDLDNFKMVNDTLGHDVGDRLLVEATRRLKKELRLTDTIARIGGDEFAIIARNVDKTHGVTVLARKLISELSKPFDIDGHLLNTGCCIGISLYPGDKCDPESLMQHADLALHRAREEGRGQFHTFDKALSQRMHERLEIDRDLRLALYTDQFYMVYQPRFNARTRKPVAAEALARWQHPKKGFISPGAFIPVAEETGLVVDLGRVALDQVARDIARWRDDGLVVGPVSVNISPEHLAAGTVLEDVMTVLKKYDLPPAALQVEVTEGTMITDEEAASSQIKQLAAAGIEILIDDFGTGYSSLSYLHRFKAHELKIDRSFVNNVMDPTSAILARQIVSIGKSLDLRIVAEGVETEAQAEFMTAIGCDELQGFLLAKPLSSADFEKLMRADAEANIAASVPQKLA
ncbi:MAG: EAL domain-containing protein [Parvibaculum sp.]